MVWQCLRKSLLIGVVLAVYPAAGWAEEAAPTAPPAAPAHAMRTICVRECVPETFTTTRTVYERVCKQEKYTAYRCETVPTQQTRTVTVFKTVNETKPVTRTVWECVPTVEQRTVMQPHVTCKPVTVMTRKCEDHGHYECREVPCQPSLWQRLKKHCQKNDCCEPCCPPPTKTVKVWVPCKVWVEVPVTKMQRVCEYRPVTCQVTVQKRVAKQVTEQVTVCRSVPVQQTQTCTVMVTKRIPVEATRTVVVCVPKQETVTCTRNVWKTVQKQVPVETCCETTCCSSPCGGRKHHFGRGGLHARQNCCD
jgi:hypothetical protein